MTDSGFGPLVGTCEGCGGRYVLTCGLCGMCAQDGRAVPDLGPIVPPSIPMPDPDPFYKRFVERTLAAMDVAKARKR